MSHMLNKSCGYNKNEAQKLVSVWVEKLPIIHDAIRILGYDFLITADGMEVLVVYDYRHTWESLIQQFLIEERLWYTHSNWYPKIKGILVFRYNPFQATILVPLTIRASMAIIETVPRHCALAEFHEIVSFYMQKMPELRETFVRLNHCSTKDYIIKPCTKAEDILDCLRKSDRCVSECRLQVQEALVHRPPMLVLQTWNQEVFDMQAYQFRCFVRSRRITGVTQSSRDLYHDDLASFIVKERFVEILKDFFTAVRYVVPFEDWVMDVVLVQRRIFVLKMLPFGMHHDVDSFLFSWTEDGDILMGENESEMRTVGQNKNIVKWLLG